MAPDTADLVRAAGGWLFDQAMSGWDVMALVADDADRRPLRILGVRGVNMRRALTSPVSGPRPHAVAVSAEVFESDTLVRRNVLRSLDDKLTEVRVWGWTDQDPVRESSAVRHRLSVAARAFKTHALAALNTEPRPVDPTEEFRDGELLPRPPDMAPAA